MESIDSNPLEQANTAVHNLMDVNMVPADSNEKPNNELPIAILPSENTLKSANDSTTPLIEENKGKYLKNKKKKSKKQNKIPSKISQYYRKSQLSNRICIPNIPRRTREEELQTIFGKYGTIKSIDMKTGVAFIEYEYATSAQDAIKETHESELDRNYMVAEMALPKKKTHKPGEYDICFNCGERGHWYLFE